MRFSPREMRVSIVLDKVRGYTEVFFFLCDEILLRTFEHVFSVTLPSQGGQDPVMISPHGQGLSPNQGAMVCKHKVLIKLHVFQHLIEKGAHVVGIFAFHWKHEISWFCSDKICALKSVYT